MWYLVHTFCCSFSFLSRFCCGFFSFRSILFSFNGVYVVIVVNVLPSIRFAVFKLTSPRTHAEGTTVNISHITYKFSRFSSFFYLILHLTRCFFIIHFFVHIWFCLPLCVVYAVRHSMEFEIADGEIALYISFPGYSLLYVVYMYSFNVFIV